MQDGLSSIIRFMISYNRYYDVWNFIDLTASIVVQEIYEIIWAWRFLY